MSDLNVVHRLWICGCAYRDDGQMPREDMFCQADPCARREEYQRRSADTLAFLALLPTDAERQRVIASILDTFCYECGHRPERFPCHCWQRQQQHG